MDRGRSAGQRHIFEMSSAFVVFIAGDERFSAPDISVGAVAGAIEDKSDYSAFKMILRMQLAMWAWWCCTPTNFTPLCRSAHLLEK